MSTLSALFLFSFSPSKALAGPIYVYQQPDGSKKFSTKPPPNGIEAQVFTARKSSFSWYRVIPQYGGRNLYPKFGNAFNEIILRAAAQTKVDAALIKAVIHAESGFNQVAISPKGARGLMQLMPGTARDLGVSDSFSPDQNIMGGAKYLSMLLEMFKGDVTHAVAAYNAGMEPVKRYQGIPPYAETQNYVRNVLNLLSHYRKKL